MSVDTSKLNLFSFSGKIRILHLSWVAFFISFFVWFNHAPLLGMMRPAGGWISDKFGRKLSLSVLMFGTGIGYYLLSLITNEWSISLAVAVVIFSSLFVNAGNGAVFAIVPLVKRRMTGQIAGMAGAYGNVGAVTFLTVLSFVATDIFFMVIAAFAIVVFTLIVSFLENPEDQMAEVLPDGTVQMIEVN